MWYKIAISVIITILTILISINILDNKNMSITLKNIIGLNSNQLELINKYTGGYGTPVSMVSYIYKIKNKKELNCSVLSKFENSEFVFDDFEKQYINMKSKYCSVSLSQKNNRLIYILIQNDIFIIKIFTD